VECVGEGGGQKGRDKNLNRPRRGGRTGGGGGVGQCENTFATKKQGGDTGGKTKGGVKLNCSQPCNFQGKKKKGRHNKTRPGKVTKKNDAGRV